MKTSGIELDFELIKKNPDEFFSQLDEQAEKEFINILEYFIFKYNLKLHFKENNKPEIKENNELFPKKVKEFKLLTRDEIYVR